MSSKKKQKTLNKRCPECGSSLLLVAHIETKYGVDYTETFVECQDCDYSQKIRKSEKRDKNVFNPKW